MKSAIQNLRNLRDVHWSALRRWVGEHEESVKMILTAALLWVALAVSDFDLTPHLSVGGLLLVGSAVATAYGVAVSIVRAMAPSETEEE